MTDQSPDPSAPVSRSEMAGEMQRMYNELREEQETYARTKASFSEAQHQHQAYISKRLVPAATPDITPGVNTSEYQFARTGMIALTAIVCIVILADTWSKSNGGPGISEASSQMASRIIEIFGGVVGVYIAGRSYLKRPVAVANQPKT